jgi:hypothetical protein
MRESDKSVEFLTAMRRRVLFEFLLEPAGIYFTAYVIVIIDYRLEKWDAGIDALNLERRQRLSHAGGGLSAIPAMDDELCQK